MPASKAKRSSAAELRERIIAAAIHHFAEQGYAGTSVKRIAESVGISKQLLLYHFTSKEELRTEIVQWLARLWKDFLPKFLAAVSGDDDPFEAAVKSWVALFEEHPDIPRYILRELITPDSDMPDMLLELVGPGMMMTSDSLRRLQTDGQLDPAAKPEAMLALTGLLLLSVFATSRPDQKRNDHRVFNEGMVEEAMRMIRASFSAPAPGAATR